MSSTKLVQSRLEEVVERLSRPESCGPVQHRTSHGNMRMPSRSELGEAVEHLRSVLFPGYFGTNTDSQENLRFQIGYTLGKGIELLTEQIKRGFCFSCPSKMDNHCKCTKDSAEIALEFLDRLPNIREVVASHACAAYNGDPACSSIGEAIYCSPSIFALTNNCIAHELHLLRVPIIPRMIAEDAHSRTGIDIHPGAQIGKYCFIDHGTGTVIGETSIIGENVRIYQGVTLGAKSFPLDENGNPVKGIPRHPIVEDEVTIYAGATILGRVTIGKGAEIGGNVWLTYSVAPNRRISQHSVQNRSFRMGEGI